jgi:two-component system, chemotaxis family, chemotaxis protein CheY
MRSEDDMGSTLGSTMGSTMGSTITLPAVVDLAVAESLLRKLREALATGQPCRLDASGVEKLMLPGVQVILSAIRSGAKLEVVNPSLFFRSAFDDAALSFGEAVEEPAQPAQADAHNPTPAAPESEASPQAAPSPAQGGPAAAKRILTIDDSKTMRDMLRLTLVDAGYDVLQAVDGQDGLNVLSKQRVDVVITDINMPKLDGYGVIRHLRADAGYDDTPILVLSTESDQKTKDIGREAGATGWLVKPFDPDQLVEIVRQVSP